MKYYVLKRGMIPRIPHGSECNSSKIFGAPALLLENSDGETYGGARIMYRFI
jgi:hypothetical protein